MMSRALLVCKGPRSTPSQFANTGPVGNGSRGLTSRQASPVTSFSTCVSSIPVPVPITGMLARHDGTSAPSIAARSCRSPAPSSRNVAAASAEPPPKPAATGKRLSRLTRNAGNCPSPIRRAARVIRLDSVGPVVPPNAPLPSKVKCSAGSIDKRSPSSRKANSVSRS